MAVYKPAGISVHRGDLSTETHVVMTILRDQLGRYVWPLHRLDRPTAGVLLFALSSEAASVANHLIRERLFHKSYLALARGWMEDEGEVDHPLSEVRGELKKAALTRYQTLARIELPIGLGEFDQVRYSLVRVFPFTGRYHQIRKHLRHLSHPLVGDTVHGDGRHNRLFRENFGWHRLGLLAESLRFVHPLEGREVEITAEPDLEWRALLTNLGLDYDALVCKR